MQKFLLCGVLLVAPLVSPAEATTCPRPQELLGAPVRHHEQVRGAHKNSPRVEYATTSRELVAQGVLVRIENGTGYYLNGIGTSRSTCENPLYPYPDDLRVGLPEVRDFLTYLGEKSAKTFPGTLLKIPGLARTRKWHADLHHCGLSAFAESPHEWGAAVDISKKGLSDEHVCWLWDQLLFLQEKELVIAVDEQWGNHLHVYVRPEFSTWLRERQRRALPADHSCTFPLF